MFLGVFSAVLVGCFPLLQGGKKKPLGQVGEGARAQKGRESAA